MPFLLSNEIHLPRFNPNSDRQPIILCGFTFPSAFSYPLTRPNSRFRSNSRFHRGFQIPRSRCQNHPKKEEQLEKQDNAAVSSDFDGEDEDMDDEPDELEDQGMSMGM